MNYLMDLDLKGERFTWFSYPRNGFITREKIDRALANWEWRALYHHASLIALPAIRITRKIENCKEELKNWSKKTFKRADKEIYTLKDELKKLQDLNLAQEKQEMIQLLKENIAVLWKQEEKYWG
ncbi:hypothetical protein Ahy_B03g065360 [Arachis hypogaea]|uniref:Uncharacterized protein n=1 Tax=Arachis hypogaea TaxID=3818 RepID=A0A445A1J7_ARAHY|nr:hypothetical protein Ahy_B03g065360 [Arachis hypogaea]